MSYRHISQVYAITGIDGSGQKCIAASIEYDQAIDGSDLNRKDFIVEGRYITAVYTNESPLPGPQKEGRYVVLELSTSGNTGSTREMTGHGPQARSVFHEAVVRISQKGDIKTASGVIYPGGQEVITSGKAFDIFADSFNEFSFNVPGTDRELKYQLYIPDGCNPEEKYPLVLFLHDAGSCADEAIAPLAQGSGAIVWSCEEEQRKHKCFVLAPCYPTVCANDEFQVTPETEYTVELIKEITREYPIDVRRIYGTGQSMGCMMLCEMNIRYPDLFGGCLLVAGQWNPETMASCKNKNFWIIVSQGDRKAYPIMGACMKRIEKAGGKVTRAAINAKASDEELRAAIEKLEEDGCHMYFTWFEGESIIPDGMEANPGMHHILTWARAYDITALRDWLFKQSL